MVRKCLCQLSNSCTIPPDEIHSYILKKNCHMTYIYYYL